MVNAILSLAAFGASASALGLARVVNKCTYDVFMCETPAEGGGYSLVEKTLQPGDSWEQQYTALSNGAGWSIKLSKEEGSFGTNILQYEYAYQNVEPLWYDLSAVDGNPWDKNWEISSSHESCNPRQAAYRFATDDAYGMQDCPSDATITVTLCSGEASDASPADYSSSSESASVAPTYVSPSATTFATVTTAPSYEGGAITVTEVVTEVATAFATAYAKRHEHHPRGAHEHA